MLDVNDFDTMRISLAEAQQIRQWSNGEVKKPETINYRTLKPEKDGLFCEKIFGPTRDWECYCGKYKRVRFRGIICERCGVEVTRSKVRRERMGHVELAAPVTHIWYLKGVPSRLGYLLDMSPKDLEKIIYFAAYVITHVDEDGRHRALPELVEGIRKEQDEIEKRKRVEKQELEEQYAAISAELKAEGAKSEVQRREQLELGRQLRRVEAMSTVQKEHLDRVLDTFKRLSVKQLVQDEAVYRDMRQRFGQFFSGGMGAEGVRDLLEAIDLEAESVELRRVMTDAKGQKKQRAIKRLKVVEALRTTGNRPSSMVLEAIPVIPPDLRPMVQLDGGRFATSDLNDLYRRVINRNNRLKRLLDLGAPEIIVNNEKRMLQEAVDALFDNGRRGRPVTGPGNRPLKSLSDMLKGKQGRFRQNLLGKRVDYSGRSVIVAGPNLRMHQCGLPKQMALELFKPFVMKLLVDRNYAQNIKSAKRMVERQRPQVWDVLEDVIADHPVLLNRAPTLHRLGIQAFMPILVEGKAIQLHPLVCTAFNADFDGDQMAVHLPLSAEAQAEARILMLGKYNILSPATGRPIASPTQDMVLGVYWLTYAEADLSPDRDVTGLPVFSDIGEIERAVESKLVGLQDAIVLRIPGKQLARADRPAELREDDEAWEAARAEGARVRIVTTPGRAIFNAELPLDYEFVNRVVTKKVAGDIVNQCADQFTPDETVDVLDAMKDLGYRYATRSGITVAVSDVETPALKAEVLAQAERAAARIEEDFAKGVIFDAERRQELIEIWTRATAEVSKAMEQNFEATNPFFLMADSGARGNMTQLRQIAAMRGLVANPKGEIIPRPIKSNFREGLSVLEYFISTHGARKGLADTALRTADSGYLTRRLVDVSQDLIVRESDCGTGRFLDVVVGEHDSQSLFGRILGKDVTFPGSRKVLMKAGTEIADTEIRRLRDALLKGLDPDTAQPLDKQPTDEDRVVQVRSVLFCRTEIGVCQQCYGRLLARGALVDIGEAVGIIAAQSIGEPGTQLTMRTFHTGGVASAEDITQGLPRVVELFEARSPRGKAEIARIAGRVSVEDRDGVRVLTVNGARSTVDEHELPKGARLFRSDDGSFVVEDGASVEAGQQLTNGAIDPHDLLEVLGSEEAELHLLREVQDVYRSQGVPIHDKHVELIVRQMFRRRTVIDSGDTRFLLGDTVTRARFEQENARVQDEGAEPAAAREMLMGITKASLATDSWLSAASFQETTRVLTEAALSSASDDLVGLKENVIIGKLIPAGTGVAEYRDIEVAHTEMPEQVLPADLAEFLAASSSYEGDGSWDFQGGWGYDDFPGPAAQG
ncbi:MAG: DNA-directed polymerase subunit beta [Actinomycetota bacterium]